MVNENAESKLIPPFRPWHCACNDCNKDPQTFSLTFMILTLAFLVAAKPETQTSFV